MAFEMNGCQNPTDLAEKTPLRTLLEADAGATGPRPGGREPVAPA